MKYSTLFLCLIFITQTHARDSVRVTTFLQKALQSHYAENDLRELKLISSHTSNFGLRYYYIQQQFRNVSISGAMAVVIEREGDLRVVNHKFLRDVNDHLQQTSRLSGQALKNIVSERFRQLKSRNAGTSTKAFDYLWYPKHGSWTLCKEFRIETETNYWRILLDAEDGSVVDQKDLVHRCSFGSPQDECSSQHKHVSNNLSTTNMQMSETYNAFPLTVESPAHGARTIISNPSDPVASPFGWHDTDGAPGAEFTDTRGNNTYSQLDPTGTNFEVHRPDGGANLQFDFNLDLEQNPETFADAAVTNLFYWTNVNHDIFYHYGFDEVAGNFQVNNYGRGGLDGDQIYADAQDGAEINNAVFRVAEDGSPARMEMFLWTQNIFDSKIVVQLQDGTTVEFNAVESAFSFNNKLISKEITSLPLVRIRDANRTTHLACLNTDLINKENIAGKVAVLDRGECFFVEKVKRMQDLGAKAVIVCNNVAGDPIIMGGEDNSITIPAVMISADRCEGLLDLVSRAGSSATITWGRGDGAFDSSLDNLIITHEYAHGVTTRLTGGKDNIMCLDNDEQMGEGWSDYFGLMLTTDWQTANGSDRRGIGTYVTNQSNKGKGIRNYPYSTNMSTNPVTYDNVKLEPQIHALGAVWCSMIWDMTWEIIARDSVDSDLYNGVGGNNIAMRLVMEALKLQPCNPGFVDGRDAILAADSLLYKGKYQFEIWRAFARRGLGALADQGSSLDATDGVSDFSMPELFRTRIDTFDAFENEDNISVHFKTIQEFDNLRFEIRRSTDNQIFQTIKTVEGLKADQEGRSFTFDDQTAMPDRLYYYRLIQVSENQEETLMGLDSAILLTGDITLFPNPARDFTNLKLRSDIIGPGTLSIFDALGKRVSTWQLIADELHDPWVINTSLFSPGHYTVMFTIAEDRYQYPLVITH